MGEPVVWRKSAGATLLEFAVAASVLGVLAFVLLDRMTYYQALAEKTTVEMTVINMRSGLRYKVAEMLMHGRRPNFPVWLRRALLNGWHTPLPNIWEKPES